MSISSNACSQEQREEESLNQFLNLHQHSKTCGNYVCRNIHLPHTLMKKYQQIYQSVMEATGLWWFCPKGATQVSYFNTKGQVHSPSAKNGSLKISCAVTETSVDPMVPESHQPNHNPHKCWRTQPGPSGDEETVMRLQP